MRRFLAGLAVTALAAASFAAAPPRERTPAPTVRHLPDDAGIHGHPLWDPWFDPADFGYTTDEYFVSGTATATGSDQAADYTTRIVVTRPADAEEFSGTVLLDWVNVTAQFENAVNTLTSVEFLLREGWAFVHVSAQAAGVCCSPLTPKVFDPVRYAALDHPGDDHANDMFRQVARAVRDPAGVDPMDGLPVEVVIAAGQSQGGSRLSDYVATTATHHGPVDAVLQQAGGTKHHDPAPPVPVIHLLGDREGTPASPTPWRTYRLWEVAGSAHQDSWVGRQQTEGQSVRLTTGRQLSREEAEALWASAGNYGAQVDPRSAVCVVNGALLPTRYVANAALAHLDRWVRGGPPAPTADRFTFDGDELATDADGNTLGGIRLPPMEVPMARYEADLCNLGGITVPFSDAELANRYGDHATYHEQMVTATERSVAQGFVLPADGLDLLARSCAARNRFGEPAVGPCEPTPAFADRPDRGRGRRDVALVANAEGGTVSIVDSHTLRVVRELDVLPDGRDATPGEDDPVQSTVGQAIVESAGGTNFVQDLDLSPDGRTLYVSRGHRGDVAAFDLATGRMRWKVPVSGLRADHMTLSADGRRLHVSALTANVVEVVDTGAARVVGSVPTGEWPHDNHLSHDGERLYNASIGNIVVPAEVRAGRPSLAPVLPPPHQLTVADTESLDVERTFTFDRGIRPYVVTRDESRMYAQLSEFHGLVAFDLDRGVEVGRVELPVDAGVTAADYSFEAPHHGLAVSDDERTLCAAGRASDYVALVSTTDLSPSAIIDVGDAPSWATTSRDGRHCYVPNTRDDTLSVVSYRARREVARVTVGDGPKHVEVGAVPVDVLGRRP